MTVFSHRSLTLSGEVSSGEVEASDLSTACETLKRQGLTPLKVSASGPTLLMRLQEPVTFMQGPRKRDIQAFLRDLARLLKAGLSIDKAVDLIIETQTREMFADMLGEVKRRVRKGDSLATALADYGGHFPVQVTAAVHAGEVSGTLPDTLDMLSDAMDRALSFRERLKSALIYPAILFVMVIATMVLVVSVVLPQFAPFFEGNEDKLPLTTRLMMNAHTLLNESTLWVVLATATSLIGLIIILNDPRIRARLVENLARVKPMRYAIVTPGLINFARTLGVCSRSGIALDKAYLMAMDTVSVAFMRDDLMEARKRLRRGELLSKSLSDIDWCPNMILQFARVGEQSGRLGQMLEEVADLIEQSFETRTEKTLDILSPLLTLIMGGIVALLVGSVLLGIMSINDVSL